MTNFLCMQSPMREIWSSQSDPHIASSVNEPPGASFLFDVKHILSLNVLAVSDGEHK